MAADQAQGYEYVRRLWIGDGYQEEIFDEKNNNWINRSQGETIEHIRNNNKSAYERRKKNEWLKQWRADNWTEEHNVAYEKEMHDRRINRNNTRPTRRRKQKPMGKSNIPNDFFHLRERHNLREGNINTKLPPHKERNTEDLRDTLNSIKSPQNELREGDTRRILPQDIERKSDDLRGRINTPKAQPPNEIRERRKIDPAELTLSSDSEPETTRTRINYKLEATRTQQIRSVVVVPKAVNWETSTSKEEEKTEVSTPIENQPQWLDPILQHMARQNERILQLMEERKSRKSRKSSSRKKKSRE